MSNLAKTDIVINKADKGSSIVIMNKSEYINRGNLSNTSTYEPYNKTLKMNSKERST